MGVGLIYVIRLFCLVWKNIIIYYISTYKRRKDIQISKWCIVYNVFTFVHCHLLMHKMGEERRISFGVKKHVATLEIHGVCGSLSKIIQSVALKLVTLFPFPTYFFTLMSFLIYLAGFQYNMVSLKAHWIWTKVIDNYYSTNLLIIWRKTLSSGSLWLGNDVTINWKNNSLCKKAFEISRELEETINCLNLTAKMGD